MQSELLKAFLFRYFRSIKQQLTIYLMLLTILIVLMIALSVIFAIAGKSSPSIHGINVNSTIQIASNYISSVKNLPISEAVYVYGLLLMTTVFAGLMMIFSTIFANIAIPQILANDKTNGALEVLLSRYTSFKPIFNALLFYSLLGGLISLAITFSIATAIYVSMIFAANIFVREFIVLYLELALLLAPSVTLLSSVIGLIISVKFTSLATKQIGFSPYRNIAAGIATIPALIPFYISILSETSIIRISIVEISGITAAVAIALFLAFLLIASKYIKTEDFIE